MTSTTAPETAATSLYAIVETSGQQMWLQPGRYYDVDRIQAEAGDTLELTDVLLVRHGDQSLVGQPTVEGAAVQLTVLSHRRGPKVTVYKMRPKKKTRRKNGHRQELTRVSVTAITMAGKPLS
ncbi:50S ribosomal protein L21 [Synechococcus sp. RSCCF101]|uniref:50S ribosomal protein L21 n=1 Tax=Synechococcus sp. RSCCF101 TaxID=2511069 RepID=UPI001248D4EE|nr:50S ribosomal protein L21 [Synechococcus sp. RSCCF101]QEY33167.1 50S ribosomal protein L21 [Synechococcus sp. RSCCF101]